MYVFYNKRKSSHWNELEFIYVVIILKVVSRVKWSCTGHAQYIHIAQEKKKIIHDHESRDSI